MKRALSLAFFLALASATSAAAADPFKKGPWMQQVTSTSVVVRVEVDPPAPLTLQVGLSPVATGAEAGAGSVIESREARALHTVVVKGLEPNTRYPFSVRAAGATRFAALTTAPREDSGAAFRFLIYGDNRTDDAAHGAIVRAMVSAPSSFLVNTGDMVANGGSKAEWQTFFDIEAPLMRERPIFSTVGNHELVDGAGADFVRYFGPAGIHEERDAGGAAPLSLEQLRGTFRWSHARFFMINGMVPYTSGASRAWLEKVLSDSDAEPGLVWRIVVVHHGPWSSGPHGDNSLLGEAKIPDLLKAHKVDLVISGHDHIYERGTADGLAYLVSGGGGAPIYKIKQAEKTSLRHESVRHFIDTAVNAGEIQIAAIRPDGSRIERCTLRKSTGWDCGDAAVAGPDGGTPASAGSSPASGAPAPSSRCGCRVVGSSGRSGTRADGLLGVMLAVVAAVALRRGRRVENDVR